MLRLLATRPHNHRRDRDLADVQSRVCPVLGARPAPPSILDLSLNEAAPPRACATPSRPGRSIHHVREGLYPMLERKR